MPGLLDESCDDDDDSASIFDFAAHFSEPRCEKLE